MLFGARAIQQGNGDVSLVHDRCDIIGEGDRKAFVELLNTKLPAALEEASLLRHDKAEEVVLFEDDEFVILGNTNASYGYVYLVGWAK